MCLIALVFVNNTSNSVFSVCTVNTIFTFADNDFCGFPVFSVQSDLPVFAVLTDGNFVAHFNERIFLTVFIGHFFCKQTVTKAHTESTERHCPVFRTRCVHIVFNFTADVKSHWRCCKCFELRHVHCISVFRASGYSYQLSGKSCFFITDRNDTYRTSPCIKNIPNGGTCFSYLFSKFSIIFIRRQCFFSMFIFLNRLFIRFFLFILY